MGGIKPNHPIYLWWEGQSARAKMSISHRASLRTRQPAPRLLLVSSQPSVDNAGGQKFTLISFCEAQTRVESLLRSERRAKCAVLAKLLLCCFRAELRSSAVRNCPKSLARARTCPYLAFESLLNSLYQNLVLERFCKERKSSRVECGLAH